MITSTKNPLIKKIRKLYTGSKARREAGLFVVEGLRMAREVLDSGFLPDIVLHRELIHPRSQAALDEFRARGVQPIPVSSHVMQTAAATASPQDILAVMPMRTLPLPETLDFVVILDRVRDPGNAGTILRTAAAAGVDAVLLPPTGVDPFNEKVVRAGMGAHFRVPIHPLSWAEIREATASLRVYAGEAQGATPYTEADMTGPLALVIGGEAFGSGPEVHALDPVPIHIPMPGGAESLNAGIAAGILIYEVVRQRQPRP